MIVRGGTIVTARGVEKADIVVNRGRIAEVGRDLEGYGQVIDAAGLHVFPGGIDSHVHFNEPGRSEWETIGDGSAALAAGGYTAFIDMPLNSLPVTTTVAAFDLKLAATRRSAKVDYGLWAGLVPGNIDQLEPLVARGAMGFKAFMCASGIDEFPPCSLDILREGMAKIAGLGSILLVHAESPALLTDPRGPRPEDFLASRPPDAEIEAIGEVISLARDTGCRTPPFRSAGNRDDLRAMLAAGEVEMVVSDHSPSTLELKQGDDFRAVWGGISGCQSTRRLLLAQDGLELPVVAAVTATRIAERFGIRDKGDIAPGFDADLWLVDLGQTDVVMRNDLLYRNRFSAHEGQRVRGRTVRTLVRGVDAGKGKPIRRGGRS